MLHVAFGESGGESGVQRRIESWPHQPESSLAAKNDMSG